MKKYLALASATFQQRLAYRNVFFISLLSQVMVLLSMYFLWRMLYASRPTVGGFSWPEMQTYLVLTFWINAVVGIHSELLMTYGIIDGSVAIDLLKPLDYQSARAVETLTTAAIEGAIALVVVGVVAFALGASLAPASSLLGGLAALSFLLGVAIKFGIVYLAGMACFWTTNGWGISWAQTAITQLFSGALVPLPLLPGWLRLTAEWLPFQATTFSPIAIFLGRVDIAGAGRILALQVGWALGLWFLGRLAWSGMMRKVTIHGG